MVAITLLLLSFLLSGNHVVSSIIFILVPQEQLRWAGIHPPIGGLGDYHCSRDLRVTINRRRMSKPQNAILRRLKKHKSHPLKKVYNHKQDAIIALNDVIVSDESWTWPKFVDQSAAKTRREAMRAVILN
ncbi:hypothetical protein LTR10_011577 [Elasticomyces elasticus]|uniref:Uncharacterized protein n=1 Tax=Exophiala sideris TaxID=1016849 RepID=A0ABR0JEJ0_9EURO|nr:hypothetical protein LTR10_011577 [Elasticomyces elasticus]KAK5031965.1 hypothetical protein LTS07_004586 [Exophiala sideris]KAK5040894.1 hypothetical protein LTR13_003195 [Exophiala sideris]KAK5061772.1 hypothetical protein LTR69_004955 [Exophiala sideris]KAK5184472.1 hypothetical protein LTR44_003146 [Eurotiomycetes sp. CCFEE 6388]